MKKSCLHFMRYCSRCVGAHHSLITHTDRLSSAFYYNCYGKSSVHVAKVATESTLSPSSLPLPTLKKKGEEEVCKPNKCKAASTTVAVDGKSATVPPDNISRENAPSRAPQAEGHGAARRSVRQEYRNAREREGDDRYTRTPYVENAAEKNTHVNGALHNRRSAQKDPHGDRGDSAVKGTPSNKESASAPDTAFKGSSDAKLAHVILNHLCLELTSSTASAGTTNTELQDDLSEFIEEATAGVSSQCGEICGLYEKSTVAGKPLAKTDSVSSETTDSPMSSDATPHSLRHSIRTAYKERLEAMFINPFSGKMTPFNSKLAKDLLKLGFRRHSSNLLQLEWNPRIFIRVCYQTARRLRLNIVETLHENKTGGLVSAADQDTQLSTRRKKPSGAIPENEGAPTDDNENSSDNVPRLMDQILNFMLKNFENVQVVWRQDLAKLMRRPDVLTAVGEELNRRYLELSGSYMPPKLDAIPDPGVTELKLTSDQTHILQLALRGYHLYVGGSAGTGKTVLLKVIFYRLSELGLRVAMTASTGVAAVQLGGCTFHRAFNVPIDTYNLEGKQHYWDTNALRAVDVVIIDEVSLLEAGMFDTFDMEARIARMNSAPFGGMQTIVCGDFLQLSNDSIHDSLPVYLSDAFKHLVQMKLITPMRHSASDPLLCLLNQLREGKFHAPSFKALDRPIPSDADQVTYIFPRRQYAQQLNVEKLGELRTAEMSFTPQRGPLHLVGHFTPSALVAFVSDGPAPPPRADVVRVLQEEIAKALPRAGPLCEHNAVVMPAPMANPSLLLRWRCTGGRQFPSHDATRPTATPYGRGARAKESAVEGQLKEKWASIAEKVAARLEGRLIDIFDEEPISLVPLSVSMALADMNEKDTADALLPLRFKIGCRVMVNRNLSRTVSNGSVGVVEAFMPPDISLFPQRTDIAACNYYRRALSANLFENLPVVRLLSGEVVQIPPISTILGGGPASYYYAHEAFTLPLQLGYGFTVHKVQGLTLHGTVVLDCKSFFDCPHLIYVACSRVRNINQLIVRNINPKMVIVKRSALEFSENLKSADDLKVLVLPPHTTRAAWTNRVNPRLFPLSNFKIN